MSTKSAKTSKNEKSTPNKPETASEPVDVAVAVENVDDDVDQTTKSRKKTKDREPFKVHFKNLLKNIDVSNNCVSAQLLSQLNSLAMVVSKDWASTTSNIVKGIGKGRITSHYLETALCAMLGESRASEYAAHANEALDSYEKAAEAEDVKKCDAIKCTLSLPPHIFRKVLRETGVHVSKDSPIYMAAVVEKMFADLLGSLIKLTETKGRKTLTPKSLYKAVTQDETLVQFASNVLWCETELGELINKQLFNDDRKRKLATARRNRRKAEDTGDADGATTSGKPRLLPGTKVLRQIKKLQRGTETLQRKAHFERFIRAQIGDDAKCGSDVMTEIQRIVENRMVQLHRDALEIMVHAKRNTLEASDLDLAWKMTQPARLNTDNYDGIDNLAQPGLHRISLKAGVKCEATSCYDAVRRIMCEYTNHLLSPVACIVKANGTRIINHSVLRKYLGAVGYNVL